MSEEEKKLEVLWTPQQLAKYLSISPRTVYNWLSAKRVIDPTKVVRIGYRVRIPRSEVERIAGLTRDKIEGGNESSNPKQ